VAASLEVTVNAALQQISRILRARPPPRIPSNSLTGQVTATAISSAGTGTLAMEVHPHRKIQIIPMVQEVPTR